MTPRIILKKAFFGKGNCFKFLSYDTGAVMFHFGTENSKNWQWKKVKMNDVELGDILLVLEGKKLETSFYHSFGEGEKKLNTQIWVNKKKDAKGEAFFIRIKELSKSFNDGEQRVLQALLQHSIMRMNLEI